MKRVTVALAICLFACLVTKAQVQPVPSSDIKGFYVGMPFDSWRTSPVFGGNGDVCEQKKPPKNVRQWCKTYEAAKNGSQTGISVPPFSFIFKNSQVIEVRLTFRSFDEAKSLLIAKFGEPTNSSVGGDISSGFGAASATGRVVTWMRQDGAIVMAQEIIVANSFGTSSSTEITLLSKESAQMLYPRKGYHPDAL